MSTNEIQTNLFNIIDDQKIIDKVNMRNVDYLDFIIKINKTKNYETDVINMFLRKTKAYTPSGLIANRPAFVFGDGTVLSIQASEDRYCRPRADEATFYSAVECGYPTREIEELKKYAEDPDYLTETVYPYVPVEILNELVKEKGLSDRTKHIIFDEITR